LFEMRTQLARFDAHIDLREVTVMHGVCVVLRTQRENIKRQPGVSEMMMRVPPNTAPAVGTGRLSV